MHFSTFMQGFIDGDLHENDIDDWIVNWHERFEKPEESDGETLHEYLGMTYLEYGDWVSKRRTLRQIADDRIPLKSKKPGMISRMIDYIFWKIVEKLLP